MSAADKVRRPRVAARLGGLVVRIGYGPGPRAMSWLRKRWVILRHPNATIRFGRHCYVGRRFRLQAPFGGTFIAGDGVEFRDNFRVELGTRKARVELGAASVCTYDVVIQCGTTITIGERCMLGQSTLIVDGNHRFRDPDRPISHQGYDYRAVTIGDDALLLAKATVLADVGRHTVVGAGAVVTRDIPANSVAVGAPARVVDYFGPEEERLPEAPISHSDRSG